MTRPPVERYTGGAYEEANPTWHVEDSEWKASEVLKALRGAQPGSFCEVGCGAGAILEHLSAALPTTSFVGYDIASAALAMAAPRASDRIRFELGDAADFDEHFDVMLLADVIEHVNSPIDFLAGLRTKADQTILHIPLDMNVSAVLRPKIWPHLRESVGHIHYFTAETAVATLEAAGYRVVHSFYTLGYEHTPHPTWKTAVASIPRRILPDHLGARWLGGYSMMVVAENGAA